MICLYLLYKGNERTHLWACFNSIYLTHIGLVVKAIWYAAGNVILVTALFFFALDLRHSFKATIYTLILVNKTLAIYWNKMEFVVIWILIIYSSVRLFVGSLVPNQMNP